MYLSILLQTVHKSADDLINLDPYGVGLAVISISIVFIVLISLYLIFKAIGNGFQRDFTSEKKKPTSENVKANLQDKDLPSGEVCAAIAMALYYYNSENHDYEHTILTIKKNINNYSPWNSKIYGLRKTIQK